MEGLINLNFTLAKALEIPILKQCKILAGMDGLNKEIKSVNSFDAPDVLSWLKPGELVLTTGYIFQKDINQIIELTKELAKKQCVGLGIKLNGIPSDLLQIADQLNLPILEIPPHLSLSDIMFPILKEVIAVQKEQQELNARAKFIYRIISADFQQEDAIFTEGTSLGLQRNGGFVCVVLRMMQQKEQYQDEFTYNHFQQFTEKVKLQSDIDMLTTEMNNDTIIILHDNGKSDRNEINYFVKQVSREFIQNISHITPSIRANIGIGTYQVGLNKVVKSYQEATRAIELGNKLSSVENIHDYFGLQAYNILQYAPQDVLEDYVYSYLHPLIQQDAETKSDLVNTLDTYFRSGLRPADAARRLGIHRNTMHFRIKRIKNLLHIDFSYDQLIFELKLALYAKRLISEKTLQ